MRRIKTSLTSKIVLAGAVALSTIGCLAQSTYRKDRDADNSRYNHDIADIDSQLTAMFAENADLRIRIKALRDTKVGIPSEMLMRQDQALTQDSMDQARLLNRSETRLRSDFSDRVSVMDKASEEYRSTETAARTGGDGSLAASIAGVNSQLMLSQTNYETNSNAARTSLDERLSGAIAGITSDVVVLRSDIAGVDSTSNTARSLLQTRIEQGNARTQTNLDTLTAYNTRLQQVTTSLDKLREEYDKLAGEYGTSSTAANSRIAVLEAQLSNLRNSTPARTPDAAENPGTEEPKPPIENPEPVDQLVEVPAGRNLYICIVGQYRNRQNFRYFSRHVARITSDDLPSVLEASNDYMDRETQIGISSLLTRNDRFSPVRNQSQLTRMLSSSTPTPIVVLPNEYLQNICEAGKAKVVDSGRTNRSRTASWDYISQFTRNFDDFKVYVTARAPSDIGRD